MATYLKAKPAGTPTWVDLLTPDIDASRKFYREVFGWEYDIGGPEYGGYTTARKGTLTTVGLAPMPSEMPPMPAAWNVYFATEDVGADVARVEALGGKTLYPPMVVGEFGSMASCQDPNGASFGFWQAGQHIGSQLTEDPGSTAWYELYSSDAKRARDFYVALLGATAEPMGGGMEYYVLKHGEEQLAGVMQIEASWGDFPSQWGTYFSVANADETAALVKKLGGKQLGKIEDSPFGRMGRAGGSAGRDVQDRPVAGGVIDAG